MRFATLCVVSLVLLGGVVFGQENGTQPLIIAPTFNGPSGSFSQPLVIQRTWSDHSGEVATPTDMTNAEMAALEIAATLNRYGCYLQPGQLTDWNGQQVPIVRVVSWYITWGGVQVPPDDTVMFNVCVAPAPGGEAWLVIKPVHEEVP